MIYDLSRRRLLAVMGLTTTLLVMKPATAQAQFSRLRTREAEPLVEEPFFEGLGVDVALTVQETATPAGTWFTARLQSVNGEAAIALTDLNLTFVSTTGETDQRLTLNGVVQNRSYAAASDNATAQVLLMEGDRVVAQQVLEQPIALGEAVAVQYQLDEQRPSQPWSLRYQVSGETVPLYPAVSDKEGRRRLLLPELQASDWDQ